MTKTRTLMKLSTIGLIALGTFSALAPNANAKRRYHHTAHKRASVITSWQGGAYRGRWVKFRVHHQTHYYWAIAGEHNYYRHGNWYSYPKHSKKRHKHTRKHAVKRRARSKRHSKKSHRRRKAIVRKHHHRYRRR